MDTESIARAILTEIFSVRRLLDGEWEKNVTEQDEIYPHLEKIIYHVKKEIPLRMVLPAFPAKSPNRAKTLSHLPDFGEKHALFNLNALCQRIKRIYSPGAKLTICSDGRVFADLIHVTDEKVTEYGQALQEYSKGKYDNTIEFFNLDDIYPNVKEYPGLREELILSYGESFDDLRQRCKEKKEANSMYKGIVRFMFEDYLGIPQYQYQSRTAVQKKARGVAYRVIQRSNAWSRLLSEYYVNAIRLSIHPQYRISEKIGVSLVDSDDCWYTPWHSVALKYDGGVKLMPRHQAERMANTVLVYSDGRPSHYECIGGATRSMQ